MTRHKIRKTDKNDTVYTFHYEVDTETAHLKITDVTVMGQSILDVYDLTKLQEAYVDLYDRHINHAV